MRSGTTAESCAFHEALEELLADEIFAGGKRHGNTKWSLKALAYLGLLWAWGPDEGLQQRLRRGVQIVTGWLRRPGGSLTYQGFTKLLRKWSDRPGSGRSSPSARSGAIRACQWSCRDRH